MSKKVVTLGEVMLRLSTPDFKRFVQADTFDITYGGGEANVAAALCNYGLNGTFVTKFQTTQSARQLSTTFVVME
jgi:2-dehydro-3-deoxygluconokinase